MMDIAGLIGILLVTLITFFIAKSYPKTANILYAALAIRILFVFLDNNFITLPDSRGDARIFELTAYEWSKEGFPNVLKTFPGWTESFFISFIIAIFYSIIDRSIVLAQSISLFFGILSVLMCWIITQKIWGNRVAVKAGWFAALFPSLILYSVLIMREVFVCFFLLLAINNIINWNRTASIKSFFLVLLSFFAGTVFHGGIFIGLIVFLIIVFLLGLKKIIIKWQKGVINPKSSFFFLMLIVIFGYFISSNVSIPKIGKITDIKILTEEILKKNRVTHRGDAKYPSWTIANSATELIYKIPIRMSYLTFAPFPWEVKKFSHLVGMIDSFFYMFLVYLILRNIKAIWKEPSLRIILLLLLAYLLVYGIGVANFGTGFRHRSKFVILFIILAAPLLPKFIFFKKKK